MPLGFKSQRLFDGLLSLACAVSMYLLVLVFMPKLYTLVPESILNGFWGDVFLGWPEIIGLLAITWVALKIQNKELRSVGLILNLRWLTQIGLGVLTGIAILGLAALALLLTSGMRFQISTGVGFGKVMVWLWFYLIIAITEELMFRGVVLQRLAEALGIPFAQITCGLLFAVGHWSGPRGGLDQMPVKAISTINIALMAVVLGFAFFRTGSLALPIGMHLGLNWVQGPLLGLPVSGSVKSVGPFKAVLDTQLPVWVTGGGWGLEASLLATITTLVALIILVRMKGSTTTEGDHP